MDIFTLALWLITVIILITSFIKNKQTTKDALKKAFLLGRGMALSILSIVFVIGLILSLLPPEQIATTIENHNSILATIVSALFGTITLIPAFVAFPLIRTLLNAGVDVMPSVAFLTTLTMVGVVTFNLEKKTFGLKFSLIRNSLSFVFAILIALIMGVVL